MEPLASYLVGQAYNQLHPEQILWGPAALIHLNRVSTT
jgi:hypothetical protein